MNRTGSSNTYSQTAFKPNKNYWLTEECTVYTHFCLCKDMRGIRSTQLLNLWRETYQCISQIKYLINWRTYSLHPLSFMQGLGCVSYQIDAESRSWVDVKSMPADDTKSSPRRERRKVKLILTQEVEWKERLRQQVAQVTTKKVRRSCHMFACVFTCVRTIPFSWIYDRWGGKEPKLSRGRHNTAT